MKNLTCVWRNIYNTARATHSRYYKHFAKHACDFSLGTLRFTERQRDGNVLRQRVN